MKKCRFLILLAVLACIVTALLVSASAETYGGNCGANGSNVTWSLDTDTGVLTISGTGAMKDYPYSDYVPWSDYSNSIKTVSIGNGVTSIGEYAFCYCSSLTSITVDENNTKYSSDAYGVLYNKDKTTLIQYPSGNTRTTFTIPNSVTSIGYRAFYNCRSLTSITIPNSVTSIGDMAFHECSSLTSITIPNSVTSIGNSAFSGCTGLQNTVGDLIYIKTTTNPYYYLLGTTTKSITSCTINSGTRFIGYHAFSYCSSLTSITIPNSVTSIGDYAFNNCRSLAAVYITDLAAWCNISFGNTNANPLYYAKKLYLNGTLVTDLVI